MNLVKMDFQRDGFRVDLAFDLPQKGVLGVSGPSGAGKSSILRVLAGLDHHSGVQVQFNGQTWQSTNTFVPAEQRQVGYVPQQPSLLPHLNVLDNLCFSGCRADDSSLLEGIDALGLDALLDRFPHQLSGGEQQRVALLRAMAFRPQLMLLDEPFTGLDEERKAQVMKVLRDWSLKANVPIVYVSHQWHELLPLCDELLFMCDGKKQYQGTLCEVMIYADSPCSDTPLTASIWHGKTMWSDSTYGLTTWQSDDGTTITLKGLFPADQPRRVCVGANDVGLSVTPPGQSSARNVLPGEVMGLRDSGQYDQMVHVQVNQDVLICRISNRSCEELQLAVGQPVYAQIKIQSILNWPF